MRGWFSRTPSAPWPAPPDRPWYRPATSSRADPSAPVGSAGLRPPRPPAELLAPGWPRRASPRQFRQVVLDHTVLAARLPNHLAEFEILADLQLLVAGDEQVLEVGDRKST